AVSLLPSGGSSSDPVSKTADAYAWNGSSGGSWGSAASWIDATSGANPPSTVPGSGNAVTIAGPTGSIYEIISGGGASASLSLTGLVGLAGSYKTGALTVGAVSGAPNSALFTSGSLALGAASSLSATTVSVLQGSVTLSGTGSSLSASGLMTVGTAGG